MKIDMTTRAVHALHLNPYHAVTHRRPQLLLSLTFRPIIQDDHEFLFRIYVSRCANSHNSAMRTNLADDSALRQRFHTDLAFLREHYDEASFDLILLDEQPIGHLYVERWDDEVRIIDVALAGEYRNRGIGSRLLRELLDEGWRYDKRVTLPLAKEHPALQFCRRLGFEPVKDEGDRWLLVWEPERSNSPVIAPGVVSVLTR